MCSGCGRTSEGFCLRCLADVRRVGPARLPGLERVDAAGAYEGALRRAVLRLKLRGELAHARQLAELMAPLAADCQAVVVEVPTPVRRGVLRGFNPAALLADAVARRLGLPRLSVLACRGSAPEQKHLELEQRRHARDGYTACCASPSEVLLVDDVVTTGATLDRCARALRQAGARRVRGLTAARRV